MSNQTLSKGYVVVASKNKFFHISSLNLMHSIRDFDPNANITYVVDPNINDGGTEVADVVYDCGDDERAKILGMAKADYDLTFYIDADCEVQSDELPRVFDLLGDHDMMFTALPDSRQHFFQEHIWPAGKFSWCGAVCLYKKSMKEFMQDWYDLTYRQYRGEWWPTKEDGTWDTDNYPRSLARWDQFSLWWLLNKEPKYKDLKVGRLDGWDDYRWNYFTSYAHMHCYKEPIIYHLSATDAKMNYRDNSSP